MAKKVIKSVVTDPRWVELVIKYRYDWVTGIEVMFGRKLTWQQIKIVRAVQDTGSWTSVTSGHGTGKSDVTGAMILCFMMFYPDARVIIVANKIKQVMTGVFKYIKMHWKNALSVFPWLADYFVLTDTSFYEITAKGVWEVVPKGFRLGNEEALAGEHAEHLWYIVDEASGVSDKAFGIMEGALTQDDNRLLLISQPTRPSGRFYDSHHSLAKGPHNPRGLFTSIMLNSEESPLVTLDAIKKFMAKYGGRNNPEYIIKVLGQFPKTTSDYLLGRDECERAQRRVVPLPKGWGWVACCDVGNGRDKSVLSIFRISGSDMTRRVVPYKVVEMDTSITPTRFADVIYSECNPDLFPNISIVIDGDGVGAATADSLYEKFDVVAQRIRWGRPMHSRQDRSRFISQRAYANIMAQFAIRQGRMRIDSNDATVEQASKIPVMLNEAGQWAVMKKEIMRQKLNIKSPDRWDTYCFAMLADYVPASEVLSVAGIEDREAGLDFLNS